MNAKEARELAMAVKARRMDDWENDIKAALPSAQKRLPKILKKIERRAKEGKYEVNISTFWMWPSTEEALKRLLRELGFNAKTPVLSSDIEVDWFSDDKYSRYRET